MKLFSNQVPAKKQIEIIVGMVVGGLVTILISQCIFKTPSIEEILIKSSKEMNKNYPMVVDEYLRIDSAVALPNKTIQYNYTLTQITKDEVNPDTVKKYIEPGILEGVKTNADLKFLRDKNVTFEYNYKDKNGEPAYKFRVTPEMYKTK